MAIEGEKVFTKNLIVTLETGAANLTLADANEEGANVLALQTRQQLSSIAPLLVPHACGREGAQVGSQAPSPRVLSLVILEENHPIAGTMMADSGSGCKGKLPVDRSGTHVLSLCWDDAHEKCTEGG